MAYYMQAEKDDSESGYFRLNIWDMAEMRAIMLKENLLDFQPYGDWPENNPAELEAFLAKRSLNPLQVPAYKFASNDGWLITPEECYLLAHRLRPLAQEMNGTVGRFADYVARCVNLGGFRVW